MVHFNNFSRGAFLYLVYHGSYGYFWLLKEATFPDASFKRKITLGSLLMSCVGIISLCWLGYFYMSSRLERQEDEVPFAKLCFCTVLFVVGLVIMLGADG